jgi:hypothetical protein
LAAAVKFWSNTGQMLPNTQRRRQHLEVPAGAAGGSEAAVSRGGREAAMEKTYWSNTGQILVKHWSNTGQILVKNWAGSGEGLWGLAGIRGSILVQKWSNAGENEILFTILVVGTRPRRRLI